MIIFGSIKSRWSAEGGYKEVLIMALPLILSTASWTVQQFVNRIFLTWYSPEAIAATMPAGMLSFTVLSLFMGTGMYVNTFVAQYFGADMKDRIGPAVWQGIYIAVIAGLVNLVLYYYADIIFVLAGHEALVREQETIYFKMLCLGAFPSIAASALSCFYSGMGKVSFVMWANLLSMAINMFLDYALIFGNFGFDRMGIMGAGIASIVASCVSLLFYIIMIFNEDKKKYNIFNWRFNPDLFKRLLRFGVPSGVQFFLDIAGFSVFILLIGRVGTLELAASNIAFNINILAFMPLIGLGITVSILVGQYIGKQKTDIAEYSAYSCMHISFVYMISIVMLYLLVPDVFLMPFMLNTNEAEFLNIYKTVLILIKFIALYSLFDTFNIVFGSAIKGAGDTRFVMYVIILTSIFVLIIPCYIVMIMLDAGIYYGWLIATVYIILMALIFLFRFRSGKWKSMRVIEDHI